MDLLRLIAGHARSDYADKCPGEERRFGQFEPDMQGELAGADAPGYLYSSPRRRLDDRGRKDWGTRIRTLTN